MLCSGSMELFGRVRRLRTPSGDRGHQTGDRLDEGAGEFVEDARRRPERQQVHYELYGVDGWSITFNDGKTITIRDGEKGADAPVLGIARFEGVYYWTLGGADEWLLDDAGSKIPVAGQDGKTPSVDEEGYWTIDGEPVKGADGQPVKAVGEDGDSFFEDVRQTDDEVIFILAGGETIRLPKAKEVNFVIERTTLTLKYGQTEKLAVTQKGVESYSISKPDGWRASLDGDVLSITAPVEGNIYAEKSGKVTVVAVGATATVVAAVEVNLPVFDDNNAGSSDWEEWN